MDADNLLAVATLWQEARGCQTDAQLAVAHVIRNRMARKYSSDGTVAGTVLAPWQFSGWNPGSQVAARSLLESFNEPRLLVLWLVSDHEPDPTGGAVLYYSPDSMADGATPSWVAGSTHCATIGPFEFYR